MKPPTFVCLTNVPTPYRNFFFAELRRELEQQEWRLEVWFMAQHDERRSWRLGAGDFDFPCRFLSGPSIRLFDCELHFNWEVKRLLRAIEPEVLLIGGAWIHPTVGIAARSRFAKETIFWSESHGGSMRHASSIANVLRRLALNQFSTFAVPGQLARDYVERYVRSPQIYGLPNLVNPAVFRDAVHQARRQNQNARRKRALLIVARLSQEKGLVPFLESLKLLDAAERSRLAVWIAGAGPLRDLLRRQTAECGDVEIRLLGDQSQRDMVRLYARADGFCLPSLADPNPLSVIEALWAGLPLLLSARVGNHPEALENGGNGFLFDPANPQNTATAILRWLALSDSDLSDFAARSSRIAGWRFEPRAVIRAFLDATIAPQQRTASAEAVRF